MRYFWGKWTLPSWYYRWKWAHKNVKHYLSRLHYANKHCAAVAPNTWYYFVCTSKVKAEVHDTRMRRHWALLFHKSNSFVLLTQGQSTLFPLFLFRFANSTSPVALFIQFCKNDIKMPSNSPINGKTVIHCSIIENWLMVFISVLELS